MGPLRGPAHRRLRPGPDRSHRHDLDGRDLPTKTWRDRRRSSFGFGIWSRQFGQCGHQLRVVFGMGGRCAEEPGVFGQYVGHDCYAVGEYCGQFLHAVVATGVGQEACQGESLKGSCVGYLCLQSRLEWFVCSIKNLWMLVLLRHRVGGHTRSDSALRSQPVYIFTILLFRSSPYRDTTVKGRERRQSTRQETGAANIENHEYNCNSENQDSLLEFHFSSKQKLKCVESTVSRNDYVQSETAFHRYRYSSCAGSLWKTWLRRSPV
jgi:hypothetical protein